MSIFSIFESIVGPKKTDEASQSKTLKKDIYFYVNLEAKTPRVFEVFKDFANEALSESKGRQFDFRLFETEIEAEKFIEKYNQALQSLKTLKNESPKVPCILYKRRYLVLSKMGLKNFTVRDYKKPWEPGQIFAFHDQTYFLKAKLIHLYKVEDGYRYDFQVL